tara:strand:+ start:43 stop:540 length:498 start_codon:yes stop_codon:yes gene_type:complete
MKIETIPKKDLRKAYEIYHDYTDGKSFSFFSSKFKKKPGLYVACYDKDELIGICTGYNRTRVTVLDGIAVIKKYWRKGIGSKLLRFFEKQVKKHGKKIVSVGTAGGYVEKFYMKNKYNPESFLVTFMKKKKIYIPTKEYKPRLKSKIKKQYKADEVNYIMEKEVS